jgi:hypothetical protein
LEGNKRLKKALKNTEGDRDDDDEEEISMFFVLR